jgi:hypothetical protein
MMIADVGFISKVTGSKRAMVAPGPSPGNTPINVPIKTPKKQRKRLIGWRQTEKPRVIDSHI